MPASFLSTRFGFKASLSILLEAVMGHPQRRAWLSDTCVGGSAGGACASVGPSQAQANPAPRRPGRVAMTILRLTLPLAGLDRHASLDLPAGVALSVGAPTARIWLTRKFADGKGQRRLRPCGNLLTVLPRVRSAADPFRVASQSSNRGSGRTRSGRPRRASRGEQKSASDGAETLRVPCHFSPVPSARAQNLNGREASAASARA